MQHEFAPDEVLRDVRDLGIRRPLGSGCPEGAGRCARAHDGPRAAPQVTLETLSDQRRKLLQPFYAAAEETGEVLAENDLQARFEEVVTALRGLDAHAHWEVSEDR